MWLCHDELAVSPDEFEWRVSAGTFKFNGIEKLLVFSFCNLTSDSFSVATEQHFSIVFHVTMAVFSDVPADVVDKHILPYLDDKDILCLRLVCRCFAEVLFSRSLQISVNSIDSTLAIRTSRPVPPEGFTLVRKFSNCILRVERASAKALRIKTFVRFARRFHFCGTSWNAHRVPYSGISTVVAFPYISFVESVDGCD